jgi:hypothetical protein
MPPEENMTFNFSLALLALTFALVCEGGVERRDLDLRLPTQQMVEKQTITTPIVATTNYIKTTYAGPTSAAAVVLTTFSHQPDVARNLTITPTGTTGDVESCVVTVAGKDILGGTISEDFTFAADASTAVTGSKAFKTVTSVTWPANCESGGFAATWIIGVGSKLGLSRCLAGADHFFHAGLAAVKEATAPTIAASATAVSSNTATLSSSLDGTKDVTLFFAQNYRCLP